MNKLEGARYPLLRRLALVQVAAFGILIAIVVGVVGAMSHSHLVAYQSQLRTVVKPKLLLEQERWRSWASVGLTEALNSELNSVKESLPLANLQILDRKTLPSFDYDTTLVIPEKDDGISSLVVVATINDLDKSQVGGVNLYVILALVAALVALSGVVVYSNLFIRNKIYDPIRKLNLALHHPIESRAAAFANVPALGEIKVFVDNITKLYESARESEKYEAIASMTQMLAHDVRKPFSVLRVGLAMLSNAKDPEGVKKVMSRVVPEIDRAMRSVDGMLADVMEVGSVSTALIQEPASLESLIESTLGDIVRIYPEANISFSYDLKNSHMANVHIQKMSRVYSNIVANAFQAMRCQGTMWFYSTEANGMITSCIGNAGSFIPAEGLPRLFDAFFTSGKKGGTGLGLAIAQKVISAHGGKIWCESSKTAEYPEGKVEFFFTLPISHQLNTTTANLPLYSTDLAKHLTLANEQSQVSINPGKGELSLEEDIVAAHLSIGRALRVLIVDDESIYRSALVSSLSRNPDLSRVLELTQADGSPAALKALTSNDFDLIVTDVDMGKMSSNGFELVAELRRRGSKALICVHSNRIVVADSKAAIEVGADSFMPKPMAPAQLLRLLLQAASC